MRKNGSLRKRWMINTVSIILALGLVCVFAVTAVFAAYYYTNMDSDLINRANTTTEFFADYINQSYNEYYQSCITYAHTFEDKEVGIAVYRCQRKDCGLFLRSVDDPQPQHL